ncbi:MAG TPA: cellulase family glycosylhydrolase [Candidatus Acidoferrum sp.]|nr:cellulase family glycosylhydrolase [Candidatus Acidoferrum sp.]
MHRRASISVVCVFSVLFGAATPASPRPPRARWSENAVNAWYAKQPWLVGSNYIPANAINQLEMWQAESFDPQRIDLELGWAESIGLNTMRVFLHDLLWQQDAAGFQKRINTFLAISAKHHIKPLFVLFDSCWDPHPHLGKQRAPVPGVHNSGWVQSPGAAALSDPAERPRLEAYVKGVIGAFAQDDRILGWDLWNEPDNENGPYQKEEITNKPEIARELLPLVFEWAREAAPSQPLTSGVWRGDWSSPGKLAPVERIQIENSDFISFHNYDKPSDFEQRIRWLMQYGRPILCTEYMARSNGSFFEGSLPVAKRYHAGAINWGFVAGKTQTYFPWDSWQHPYTDREPTLWFHEILRTDGRPYMPEEVALIRRMLEK